MVRRLILVALLPLLAGGCVYSLAPRRMFYPAGWPPLQAPDVTCNNVVGVYHAVGEYAQALPDMPNTRPTLLGILRQHSEPSASYVSIQPTSDDKYQVSALDAEKQPITTTIGAREPLSCRGGSLVASFAGANYADGSSHKSDQTVTLSLASDGSLVANLRGTSQTSDLLSRATLSIDLLYKFAHVQ